MEILKLFGMISSSNHAVTYSSINGINYLGSIYFLIKLQVESDIVNLGFDMFSYSFYRFLIKNLVQVPSKTDNYYKYIIFANDLN